MNLEMKVFSPYLIPKAHEVNCFHFEIFAYCIKTKGDNNQIVI